MLRIGRASGGARKLFGSDIKHNNTICLEISEAEYIRHINSEWYHPKNKIIEIELSPVQFAEAITNMNTSGIPCTIREKSNERVDKCPELPNKKEVFRSEFDNDIKNIQNTISKLANNVEKLINSKKTFTKADKDEILNGLYKIKQELNSNVPYMVECFDEQIEKSVLHSKAEIEAYIQNKVMTLGMEALREQQNNLIEENNPKEEY